MKLARHTLLNLIGLGAPLLLAVVSIPALVHALGAERFGLLTLIWAVTSYFGLFDLGLGRALTQQLAIALTHGRDEDVGPLSFTSLGLMTALGLIGGALLIILAPWGIDWIKSLPDRREAVLATWIMGLALPFIVVTAGLRGMLEACHAFEALNLIRVPMGLWTFAGPWIIVVWVGPDLVAIAIALALGRVVAAFVHLWFVWRALPQLKGGLRWRQNLVRPLCTSGGWLMVSNLINPFMAYVDRFVIGASLSAAAVAYYTTPQEMLTKLWIIPGALTGVLFPTFAVLIARRDPESWTLFDRAVAWLYVVLLPIILGLALFAPELLSAWLRNEEFVRQSVPVLQLFALGIFVSCLAHVPYTWLQSSGNNRPAALMHCAELLLYVPVIWMASSQFGLIGAAWAWLVRISFDSLAMFWLCHRQRPAPGLMRHIGWLTIYAALPIACYQFVAMESLSPRLACMTVIIVLTVWLGWRLRLSEQRNQAANVLPPAPANGPDVPLVTIVTPIYNQAEYLSETIESVLAQDYPNIEYIVIDDGSSDDSLAVARSYESRGVKVLTQANSGQAATLNKGWAMATGRVLAYLSSDDRLAPSAVTRMVHALLADSSVSVAYCDFWLIDASGQRMGAVRTEDFSLDRLRVHLVCQPGPGAFFRREIFDRTGGWDASLRQVPDFEFWLRASMLGGFHRVPYPLAEYRIHEESASFRSMSIERADEIIGVVSRQTFQSEVPGARAQAMAKAFAIAAMNHAQSGRAGMALRRFGGSLARRPAVALETMVWRRIVSGFFRRTYYRLLSR